MKVIDGGFGKRVDSEPHDGERFFAKVNELKLHELKEAEFVLVANTGTETYLLASERSPRDVAWVLRNAEMLLFMTEDDNA